MTNPTKSIAQRLLDAHLAITNSINTAEILTAVTPFGYDLPRLQAADALYDEVVKLDEMQSMEYGEQYEATAVMHNAWEEAKTVYMDTLKIARIAFRGNNKARTGLGLSGDRKQSISGWLKQASKFYNNMLRNPDFIAAMTPFSYDQAKLEAGAALVQAVDEANDLQEQERGDAQDATQARDAKMDELDQWLADYKVVAHVALGETSQQLEKLGWVA